MRVRFPPGALGAGSSVVEQGPEEPRVGGATPSLPIYAPITQRYREPALQAGSPRFES